MSDTHLIDQHERAVAALKLIDRVLKPQYLLVLPGVEGLTYSANPLMDGAFQIRKDRLKVVIMEPPGVPSGLFSGLNIEIHVCELDAHGKPMRAADGQNVVSYDLVYFSGMDKWCVTFAPRPGPVSEALLPLFTEHDGSPDQHITPSQAEKILEAFHDVLEKHWR